MLHFLYLPTCLFIQWKQTGHVTRKDVVGHLPKPARILICSDDVEDFGAGLCVAADAHDVLVRVKHWNVVVEVLYLNVHVGLRAETSLWVEQQERISIPCYVEGARNNLRRSSHSLDLQLWWEYRGLFVLNHDRYPGRHTAPRCEGGSGRGGVGPACRSRQTESRAPCQTQGCLHL